MKYLFYQGTVSTSRLTVGTFSLNQTTDLELQNIINKYTYLSPFVIKCIIEGFINNYTIKTDCNLSSVYLPELRDIIIKISNNKLLNNSITKKHFYLSLFKNSKNSNSVFIPSMDTVISRYYIPRTSSYAFSSTIREIQRELSDIE